MPNFRHLDDHAVVDLALTNGTLKISTEDYKNVQSQEKSGAVYFYNVKDMTIEGTPATELSPDFNDGEILRLEPMGDKAIIVIQWDAYQPRRSVTKAYEFSFDGMRFDGSAIPKMG